MVLRGDLRDSIWTVSQLGSSRKAWATCRPIKPEPPAIRTEPIESWVDAIVAAIVDLRKLEQFKPRTAEIDATAVDSGVLQRKNVNGFTPDHHRSKWRVLSLLPKVPAQTVPAALILAIYGEKARQPRTGCPSYSYWRLEFCDTSGHCCCTLRGV